jgi:hypothetical protein
MGGNRPIVDDAAAARLLLLHDPEGVLRTKKRARHAGIQDRTPLLIPEVFEGECGRTDTRIIEQHIQPSNFGLGCRE